MKRKKWVVAVGNPADGFSYTGPFATKHEAIAWGDSNGDHEWWLIQLESPEER